MKKLLGLMNVNCIFKLGDVSEDLRNFILDRGRDWTSSYVSEAKINGGLTKPLWNKNTKLGLKIYRDYFLCVDLVYPAYNRMTYYVGQENPEVGYLSVEIGKFSSYANSISPSSTIENNWDTIHWLEDNDVSIDDLYKELTELLGGDYRIVEDYDAEAIEEALECGDLDLLEELIGDRDLCEVL